MPDATLDRFVAELQALCKRHGVAIHGCRIPQHNQTQLGFTVRHAGQKRTFHWIAPDLTQEEKEKNAKASI